MGSRHRHLAFGLLAAASAAGGAGGIGGAARAAEVVDLERAFVTFGDHGLVALPGSLRLRGGSSGAVPISVSDATVGEEIGAETLGEARLRLMPSLAFTGASWPWFQLVQLAADADVTVDAFDEGRDGAEALRWDPVDGDRSETPAPRLTQAYLLAAGRRAALKVGLVRSGWGTGLLAHDGEDPGPTVRRSPFGVGRTADRVARAQAAWFPLDRSAAEGEGLGPPLVLALAADLVVDDDTASYEDGDRAWNLVAAIAGESRSFDLGVYAVHRLQEHAEGGRTEVTAIDLRGRRTALRRKAFELYVEGEAALLMGRTTLSQSAILEGAFEVLQLGAVGRVGVEAGALEAVVETGHASGDDNPFDRRQRAFTFDREYRVGLLLFGDWLRKATAASAFNLADETYRAEPARGFDRVATGGAVRGASYLNPRLAWHATEDLTLLAGVLTARTEGAYTDPYQSGLQGGLSVGPHGAAGRTDLGLEVDLGLHWRREIGRLALLARAEGAWYLPGDVYEDAATGEVPGDVFGGFLTAEVLW